MDQLQFDQIGEWGAEGHCEKTRSKRPGHGLRHELRKGGPLAAFEGRREVNE